MIVIDPEKNEDLKTFLGWCDQIRRLGVRTNADTPADAAQARRECDRRAVITGGMRRHPPLCVCIGEGKDRIASAAKLKGANFLQVFAFEKQVSSGDVIETLTSQNRRPMTIRLDATCRLLNVINGW